MSNSTSKTWRAALIVVGGAGAVLMGMAARDSADLGKTFSSDPLGMLVASNEKGTPQDFDIPERPYFESMAQLLREDYVDAIKDEQKLVSGAARGILLSLRDPNSIYMDKDEFRVFQSMRQGVFEGIGAEVVYAYTKTDEEDLKTFPKLKVSIVVPGGPADKAGIKSGDFIDSVNGHWIVDPQTIIDFRKVARDAEKDKSKQPEFTKMRSELRKKSETAMMPTRARDLLMIGLTGNVRVAWKSGTTLKESDIVRAKSIIEPVSQQGNTIHLQLVSGAAASLDKALPGDGIATIDLRNNNSLDLSVARELLTLLAPAGSYGKLKSVKNEDELSIAEGLGRAKKLTLIVDNTTTGTAGIVARALASKGLATLRGTPAPHLFAAEVVKLPQGDGFTLVRAEYFSPGEQTELSALNEGEKPEVADPKESEIVGDPVKIAPNKPEPEPAKTKGQGGSR